MTSIISKVPQLLFGTTASNADKQNELFDEPSSSPPPYEKIIVAKKPVVQADEEEMLINTSLIGQSVTLIHIATEMQSSHRMTMALDLYMVALDKMMSALPLDTDPRAKRLLRDKLTEIKERYDLDHEQEASGISDSIIHAAIACAVALKKSPIPDIVTSALNYAFSSIHAIDRTFNVRERTWELIACGMAKLTQMDQHYHLHQLVTGAVYTSATAIVKAGIAYTETPGYSEAKRKKL
ncbi:hypothetical protein BJV82DRAFT_597060 [Fennellomyces sp. T-0311]|nr:hypothetical protein BJV82DRAFT_597060 [Fennellomyces sp. T-0311]